jgi:hypothetical protein
MACAGQLGLELVPTFPFHSEEKLDSALVSVSEVPEKSDRTTRSML